MVRLYKNGSLITAHPIYGDDVKISKARADNEMYRRTQIVGNFTFVNDDFDTIYNASIDDEFELRVILDGITLARGTFVKGDCEFSLDDKICKVATTMVDDYTKLLAKINDEYNIVDLAPTLANVSLTRRPIMQFYMLGDKKLSHVIGNMTYEMDCAEVTDRSELTNTYHFGLLKNWRNYKVESAMPAYSYLDGDYFGEAVDVTPSTSAYYVRTDGAYKIRESYDNVTFGREARRYTFFDRNDNIIAFPGAITGAVADIDADIIQWTNDGGSPLLIYQEATNQRRYVYGRLIHANESIGGTEVPSNDILPTNRNYPYCVPIDSTNMPLGIGNFICSYEKQSDPTPWGIDANENYFIRPTKKNDGTSMMMGDNVLPLAWNMWSPMSFWFLSDSWARRMWEDYSQETILKDAMSLYSVISLLLAQIDPSIKFEKTSAYSEFLFAQENPISGTLQDFYITPVTNVERTYYNRAARKGQLSLSDIFNLLRVAFDCYWHIERVNVGGKIEKHLRIEHLLWYKNGGTYLSDSRVVLYNLPELFAPLPSKSWTWSQNDVTYDLDLLPSRWEMSWGAETTEPFDGYAMDFNYRRCENNPNHTFNANKFIGDIDFAMGAPDEIDDNFFVFMWAIQYNGKISVPIANVRLSDASPIFTVQNPWVAFARTFNMVTSGGMHKYDFSAPNARMELAPYLYTISGGYEWREGLTLVGVGTKRVKKQKVTFPCNLNTFGNEGLIITDVGTGEWTSMELNISSRCVDVELLFDQDV